MEVSIAAFGSAMLEPGLALLRRPRCDHLEQRHEDLAGQSRITPSGRPEQPCRDFRGVSVQGGGSVRQRCWRERDRQNGAAGGQTSHGS